MLGFCVGSVAADIRSEHAEKTLEIYRTILEVDTSKNTGNTPRVVSISPDRTLRVWDPVGGGDVEAETRQVLSNLQAVLRAAGTEAARVVRTTVYLVDLADFQAVNAIYAEMFGSGVSPARACVQVAALPKGSRVEIDCIAWLG